MAKHKVKIDPIAVLLKQMLPKGVGMILILVETDDHGGIDTQTSSNVDPDLVKEIMVHIADLDIRNKCREISTQRSEDN